jgi:hypothetical protein
MKYEDCTLWIAKIYINKSTEFLLNAEFAENAEKNINKYIKKMKYLRVQLDLFLKYIR